ncbi:MAG: DUF1127 domain-containing protein [Kiloniellales bacterium]
MSYSLESGFGGKGRLRPFSHLAEACVFWTLKVSNAALAEWIVRRDTRRLMEMPDHLLDDIGLSRAEIVRVVRTGELDQKSRA